MAAAYAAGIAAMIIEWAYIKGNYTAVTGNQINRLMMRAAERDPDYVYPNNIWGYGKLNIDNILNEIVVF